MAENDLSETPEIKKNINELFDDLLLRFVFQAVVGADASSFYSIAAVCRRWRAVLHDREFFGGALSLHQVCTEASSAFLSQHYRPFPPFLTSASFRHCMAISGADILRLLPAAGNLEELDLSNCWNVGPSLFQSLRLPRLSVLRLANSLLPLSEVLSRLSAVSSPPLTSLVVAGCPSFSDETLAFVLSSFPLLRSLDISCTSVTIEASLRATLDHHQVAIFHYSSIDELIAAPFHPTLYGGTRPPPRLGDPLTRVWQQIHTAAGLEQARHLVDQRHASVEALSTEPSENRLLSSLARLREAVAARDTPAVRHWAEVLGFLVQRCCLLFRPSHGVSLHDQRAILAFLIYHHVSLSPPVALAYQHITPDMTFLSLVRSFSTTTARKAATSSSTPEHHQL